MFRSIIILKFELSSIVILQVDVQMEYSRKIDTLAGAADSRVMDFGSVYLSSPSKGDGDEPVPSTAASKQLGVNIAEMLVGRGFATVIRHRESDDRSSQYDALLSAEARATSGKKGIHSAKDPPVMHITDLLSVRNMPRPL